MRYGEFKKIQNIGVLIMKLLENNPMPLNKISKALGKKDSSTIYHLKKLEKTGKIEKKRSGKETYYGLVKL